MSGIAARTNLLVVGGFCALALLVLGPLILPGYLLLLDFPIGPNPRWVSLFPLPSETIVAAASPVLSLLRLFALPVPQLLPKLTIAAVIILAGTGLVRFLVLHTGVSIVSAAVGGTLFAINPFVYDRILAGQLLIPVAYAFLPWALPSLLRLARDGSTSSLVRAIIWIALISLVNLQIGAGALLLLLLSVSVEPDSLKVKILHATGALVGLAAIHLYWVLPFFLSSVPHKLGAGDLSVYATRPHSPSVLGNVLLLQGFWRPEFKQPLKSYPLMFLFSFVPLVFAAGAGVLAAVASDRLRRPAAALGVACIIALVLAMGTSFPPTAPLSRLLFKHVSGYGVFREPQKWAGLVALGYAVFVAAGIDALRTAFGRRGISMKHVTLLGLALPLVATHVMLWGFGGQVNNSTFPKSWARAQSILEGKPGNLLFLPWHLYEPLPFAQNRVVANPAPDYFSTPTLISTSAELKTRQPTAPTDPRTNYIHNLLVHQRTLKYFGHLVAPLGIHYIALARVADANRYRFLSRQKDLRRLTSEPALTLYENKAFTGTIYRLHPIIASSSVERLLRSPASQRGASYFLNATSSSPGGVRGPSATRAFRIWPRIPSSRPDDVGTDLSCTDGWRLGRSPSICNLGVVAAFHSRADPAILWRPGFGTQLLGYALSIITVIALLVVRLRLQEPTQTTE